MNTHTHTHTHTQSTLTGLQTRESNNYLTTAQILNIYWPQPNRHADRQCTYKLTLRSVHITCCHVKAMSIKYYECECVCVCVCVCLYSCRSYPGCKAYAPHYTVICCLSGSSIFFHMITLMLWFSEKKILNIKHVLCFSLQILSETFLTVRIIQWDIKVHRSSCIVPTILVTF